MTYRITKYDPKKRNNEGHYLDFSDWTSISDIGNPAYNNLTFEDYESIETAYVESIKLILEEKNIKELDINGIEFYNYFDDFKKLKEEGQLKNIDLDFDKDIACLKDGKSLNLREIEKIIRLILRETIWMNLITRDLKVIFRYDYYMYVDCIEISNSTIKKIEKMGLFVEPDMPQKTFIILDENGNEI